LYSNTSASSVPISDPESDSSAKPTGTEAEAESKHAEHTARKPSKNAIVANLIPLDISNARR
jgi:hypothetical protein